ncbi:MAG: ion transporter [Gammaproteobacteria bacterium]|nr:ion transporter [Gammaproteobacteria bacterium]
MQSVRNQLGRWIESDRISMVIIVLIMINAILLGLETYTPFQERYGDLAHRVDQALLTIFVIELLIKIFSFRLEFFHRAWNVFDFLVIGIALFPASGPLAVLRTLRVLRVLRLISMVPKMRFIVEALVLAVPGISSLAILMLLLFYVFSVMATGLFGEMFPEWFGSIGESMYSLFQIMTLESWSMGIVRPVMEVQPHAWLFFVPFILIATFIMLNLFIGIIIDTMQSMHTRDREEESRQSPAAAVSEAQDETAQMLAEMRELRSELKALRAEINSGGSEGSRSTKK